MMASPIQLSYCGPCEYDDVTKEATRWCTNCQEGLCEDCEKAHIKNKISRNHKVISIDDYRKIENVSISEVCEHHGETLEWFCKTHDKALCMVCVPSNHKSCSDVLPINVASQNVRESSAMSDLVESIDGTLSNLKQCITNRDTAIKEIEKQELEIKKTILQTRKKINTHLDKLQEKLLQELGSTSRSCKSANTKILQKFKLAEEKLTKLREQTVNIKQFSSDIQVFLGTYQGNKSIVSETKSIKDAIDASKDCQLKLDLNSLITKLSTEVHDFGHINVLKNTAKLDFRNPKIEQAQIGIKVPTPINISNIQLQLIKTFRISRAKKSAGTNITSGVMLSNGRLLMANYAEKYLIEYNDTGEHIREIQVSDKPCCIAVIDPHRIVVTYPQGNCIEIMNNTTFEVEKKISLQASVTGVSQDNGRLYLLSGDATIQVLDLSGRQLETLQIASKSVNYLTISRDRIYFTDYSSDKVHCCLMNGEQLWQYESKSIKCPFGAAVDSNHNVFVVSAQRNLTIIKHDRKYSKTLLTETDGLVSPRDVYYDKEKRSLLICNNDGAALLYKVV